jgi:hypothetical protein
VSRDPLPSVITDLADAPVVRPRWSVAIALFLGALAFAILIVCALAMPGCSASQQRTAQAVTVVSAGAGVTALQIANHAAYTAATDALIAAGTVGAAYATASAPITSEFEARGRAIQLLARVVDAVAFRLDNTNAPLDVPGSITLVEGALSVLQHSGVMRPLTIPPEITMAVAALRMLAEGAN